MFRCGPTKYQSKDSHGALLHTFMTLSSRSWQCHSQQIPMLILPQFGHAMNSTPSPQLTCSSWIRLKLICLRYAVENQSPGNSQSCDHDLDHPASDAQGLASTVSSCVSQPDLEQTGSQDEVPQLPVQAAISHKMSSISADQSNLSESGHGRMSEVPQTTCH